MLQNLSDLDLSWSLKVKCDVTELPIYGFPLLFNSNIWHILAPLRDIGFQKNLSGLDIHFSWPLRSNVIILLDSPYIDSHSCLIVTYGASCLIYVIYKPSKSQ